MSCKNQEMVVDLLHSGGLQEGDGCRGRSERAISLVIGSLLWMNELWPVEKGFKTCEILSSNKRSTRKETIT